MSPIFWVIDISTSVNNPCASIPSESRSSLRVVNYKKGFMIFVYLIYEWCFMFIVIVSWYMISNNHEWWVLESSVHQWLKLPFVFMVTWIFNIVNLVVELRRYRLIFYVVDYWKHWLIMIFHNLWNYWI